MARVFLITSHYMGVLYIEELLRAGDEIVGVVAWPDSGGWYVPIEYDVRTKAFQRYLPLYEPDPKKLNSPEFVGVVRNLRPDFIVSGYYPKLFRQALLSIPPGGCVNIHPTGLPRFRGLSPYFTHMLFGDSRNYITMHWLDAGADTGDIIAQASVEILPDDTGFTCGHRLTEAGALMFRQYWPLVKAGAAPRTPQDAAIASVFNFDWSLAEINWSKSATEVWNLVRSLSKPLNGAWTTIGGRKLHVWMVKVVAPEQEMPVADARPGQVLAIDGDSLWVQCGSGQVRITDAALDGQAVRPFDVLSALPTQVRVVLG